MLADSANSVRSGLPIGVLPEGRFDVLVVSTRILQISGHQFPAQMVMQNGIRMQKKASIGVRAEFEIKRS